MNVKSRKIENRKAKLSKSIRMSSELQTKVREILILVNNKSAGRKVKIEMLLSVALDLVKEEHVEKLQELTLTNEDRKEILRQKWIAVNGSISKDDFTGLMLKKEFFVFLEGINDAAKVETKAS